jgi:hypothetical protein
MAKRQLLHILLYCAILLMRSEVIAQVKPATEDTFFLAKQRGLLGKLGKSLTRSPGAEPVKISNPFLVYAGRTIRSVEILPLGFDRNINDTAEVKKNFAINLANKFHVNTRTSIIRNYLFFKPGDKFLPLLASDNEKFLRDQPFLQDALIVVVNEQDFTDSIDIVVITRDVFSIGGRVNASNSRARAEVREENLGGSGSEISGSAIYDLDRNPKTGFGGEFIIRNIKGSFLNWSAGYNNFKKTYSTGRFAEDISYVRLEKPLVNRYTQWTVLWEMSMNKSINAYDSDSIYKSDIQYRYTTADLWAGYNIGYKSHK